MPVSGNTPTTWTSYAYDGMRRLITSTDFTGDTHYTYFEDGTLLNYSRSRLRRRFGLRRRPRGKSRRDR